MQEEGIVGLGVLDEPLHGTDDVGLGGLVVGVLLVVGEQDHVLALVIVLVDQEGRQVLDVVDAAAQLALLPKVVDADQQGLATPVALRVLECVSLGRAVAELDRTAGQLVDGTTVPVTGAAATTIVARLLLDGIAIGIVALGRRMGRALVLLRRRLAVLLLLGRVLLIAASVLRRVLALAVLLGRRLTVLLGGRRILSVLRLGGLLAVAAAAVLSAAVLLRGWCAGPVVALAGISAVRHGDAVVVARVVRLAESAQS